MAVCVTDSYAGSSLDEGAAVGVSVGVLALLEAKPGKGDDLAKFLEGGRALAAAEPGTVVWYAFRVSDTTYGIFDAFIDESGRQAHLNRQTPAALGEVADDLLAAAPDIRTIDVLAVSSGDRRGRPARATSSIAGYP